MISSPRKQKKTLLRGLQILLDEPRLDLTTAKQKRANSWVFKFFQMNLALGFYYIKIGQPTPRDATHRKEPIQTRYQSQSLNQRIYQSKSPFLTISNS